MQRGLKHREVLNPNPTNRHIDQAVTVAVRRARPQMEDVQTHELSFHLSAPGLVAVQCSRCEKWRKMVTLEQQASVPEGDGDDAAWFCEQNLDPAFAACSVPEEASS